MSVGQVVTEMMRDIAIDPERFAALRDQLLREYRNRLLKPLKLAGYERCDSAAGAVVAALVASVGMVTW